MTRQLTGAAALPSKRFVSTASITVPSNTGWSEPTELMGPVAIGRALACCEENGAAAEALEATAVASVPGAGANVGCAYRDVARTTASATWSILGGDGIA